MKAFATSGLLYIHDDPVSLGRKQLFYKSISIQKQIFRFVSLAARTSKMLDVVHRYALLVNNSDML